MQDVFSVLRLALFVLSCLGWWHCFRAKIKVDVHFIPVLVISVQMLLLFLSGLFNLLLPVSYAMHALGLYWLIRALVKERFAALKPFATVGFLFLGLTAAGCLMAVHGKMFTHYDNFSHWALVVKQMLTTNRFPNFQDTLITFQSYPLGSASYLYFVCLLVGQAEWLQMFAQVWMMLTCLMTLFAFVRHHGWLAFAAALLLTNFVFVYLITITELLVDVLLGVSAGAVLLFMLSQWAPRVKAAGKEDRLFVLTAFPMLTMLLLLKNAGMFFVLAAALVMVKAAKENKALRQEILWSMVLPLVVLLLWNRHCAYVFSDAASSKHAVSFAHYFDLFLEKSPGQMFQVLKNLVIFSVTGVDLWLTVGMGVVIGGAVWLTRRDLFSQYGKLFAGVAILYTAYMIGLLLTYLFSMNLREATKLAGVQRYRGTMLILILMMLTAYAFHAFSGAKSRKSAYSGLIAAGCMIVLIWHSCCGFATVFNGPYFPEKRMWMESVIGAENALTDETYIVCETSYEHGYPELMSQYLYGYQAVYTTTVSEQKQLDTLNDYDYIVNNDPENELLSQWLSENYPEQQNQTVIEVNTSSEK